MESVKYYIVKKRIPINLRKKDLFYYELRHYDNNENKYVIENNVLVNFYGTLITNKEILHNREFIERRVLSTENILIKDKTLL